MLACLSVLVGNQDLVSLVLEVVDQVTPEHVAVADTECVHEYIADVAFKVK